MARHRSRRGRGRSGAFSGGRLALAAALALVILLAAILATRDFAARQGLAGARGADARAGGSAPYGLPEYVVEIPGGYEGLLPLPEGSGVAELEPAPDRTRGDGAGAGAGAAGSRGTVPGSSGQGAGAAAGGGGAGSAPGGKSAGAAAEGGKAAPSEAGANRRRPDIPPARREPGTAGTLIIVLDDAGYSLPQLKPFLDLPFPVTIAVLPGLPHTADAARLAAAAGKEIILHQPMQALGGQDPGPGAILLGMEPAEAGSILASNLDQVPGAIGVNNHMGSAVSRDLPLMRATLELAKERGIYYLDSLTVPDPATREAGLGLDMHLMERDVFLDNTGDRASILRALNEGKRTASSRGAAVMIGHVWSDQLASTLMEVYPQLVAEGYSLSTISRYMLLEAARESEDDDGLWD